MYQDKQGNWHQDHAGESVPCAMANVMQEMMRRKSATGIAGTNLNYDQAIDLVRRHKMKLQQQVEDELLRCARECPYRFTNQEGWRSCRQRMTAILIKHGVAREKIPDLVDLYMIRDLLLCAKNVVAREHELLAGR